MKSITFDGRIGSKGAEVFTTKGGKQYVRFSVANNSFVGGQEKTEWFDVTTYDPYVIEKRVQYLTKGTYVIISGSINTEVKVGKDNNLWVNQYVTANTIDTPSFKKKEEDGTVTESVTEPTISTFTAGTRSEVVKPQVTSIPEPVTVSAPAAAAIPEYSYNGGFDSADDDLPF